MIAISDIKNKYGNSMALTLLCCRIYFKTAEINDLSTFLDVNDIVWPDFFKTCRKHRIRPLVYRIILKITLPEEIKKKVNDELRILTIKSFEQAKETERIILLLLREEIKLIPYKGTAFSKQFFDDINMRESSDIDLIISTDDLPKAITILENDGFLTPQKKYYNSIGHKKFIKSHKDFCFDKFNENGRLYHIELHFNIIAKSIHVPRYQNKFNIELQEKETLIKKEINLLNSIEHFRALSLHHMLMDSMGYMKIVIDLTQALNKLKLINSFKEHNSFKIKTINELNTIYNIDSVQTIIYGLIGIEFKANVTKKTKNNALINRILTSSYRNVRENNLRVWDALTYRYFYFKYSSHFYIKPIDKFLFLFKIILSMLIPQPDDYIFFKLNKNFHFIYFFIRPFRLLFFPLDPSKQKKSLNF